MKFYVKHFGKIYLVVISVVAATIAWGLTGLTFKQESGAMSQKNVNKHKLNKTWVVADTLNFKMWQTTNGFSTHWILTDSVGNPIGFVRIVQ